MLKHTLPSNKYEEAVILRARQLTDFKWTPIRDVPTYKKNIGNTVLKAGQEVTGFPYASTELINKFITENVSIETFLSAIQNPYSKIYQPGKADKNACNYGIVCNGLVRYAFGIERRIITYRWHTLPGMSLIAPKGQYNVSDINLCDILLAVNDGRNHVALITDIIKNDNDDIISIEVSEAVRPSCERVCYDIENFYEKYAVFALWRYDYLNKVPLFDEKINNLLLNNPYTVLPKITVDNGNKSNYIEGEETIVSVFGNGLDSVIVEKDGSVIEEVTIENSAVFIRIFEKGYYVLKLKSSGDFVEFCVNKAQINHKVIDNIITVFANPCDNESEIVYMDFRTNDKPGKSLESYEELSDEEKKTGEFTREIPEKSKNFKVYFRNKYGIWVHSMTPIFD